MNKKQKETVKEICDELLGDACTIEMVSDYLVEMESDDPKICAIIHTLRYHERHVRDNANFIKGLIK